MGHVGGRAEIPTGFWFWKPESRILSETYVVALKIISTATATGVFSHYVNNYQ
jgi:hypothetical protein